jgi:hypothetical protein
MPRHYDDPKGDPEIGNESARDLEILSTHISRWWGNVPEVFHEIVSEYVHIDLHLVPARPKQPYHVVVTTGMSDRPMTGNNGLRYYCELLLALPPDWPIDLKNLKQEKFWWPFRQLKEAARFPHVFETCIWYGHTIANEDPPEPFHTTAPFCGGILSFPALFPKEASSVHVREGKDVFFFSLIPLFEAELRFAWKHGADALFEKLDRIELTEFIKVDRECAV